MLGVDPGDVNQSALLVSPLTDADASGRGRRAGHWSETIDLYLDVGWRIHEIIRRIVSENGIFSVSTAAMHIILQLKPCDRCDATITIDFLFHRDSMVVHTLESK